MGTWHPCLHLHLSPLSHLLSSAAWCASHPGSVYLTCPVPLKAEGPEISHYLKLQSVTLDARNSKALKETILNEDNSPSICSVRLHPGASPPSLSPVLLQNHGAHSSQPDSFPYSRTASHLLAELFLCIIPVAPSLGPSCKLLKDTF